MWPFSKKHHFPGVQQNSDGTINFSLTDEETREADRALLMFKGYVVHPDAAEKMRNGTIAVALSHYAKDIVTMQFAEAEGANRPVIQQTLEKAVAAVWKAYSLCSLPAFIYHRANLLQMLGEKVQARQLFASFVKKQAEFKADQIDMRLLDYEGTNIEKALLHANREVAQICE
jgi:hypothetical protein